MRNCKCVIYSTGWLTVTMKTLFPVKVFPKVTRSVKTPDPKGNHNLYMYSHANKACCLCCPLTVNNS